MTEEQRKLVEALWVIKGECKKYNKCTECPFGNDSICLLQASIPERWDLKSFDETNWSPFRRN